MIRFWTLLLLAAIGLQAAAPVGAPLMVRHGSAFNAATVDVAVAPQRPIEADRQVALPQPAPPPTIVPEALASVAALDSLAAPRPDSTGPPAIAILKRQPAPRGPPIA